MRRERVGSWKKTKEEDRDSGEDRTDVIRYEKIDEVMERLGERGKREGA